MNRYITSTIGFHPEVNYIEPIYFCDCGSEVGADGEMCDRCIVENAEGCGDWDEESIKAKQRLKNH